MELNDSIIKVMKTGRVDQEFESKINSLDFHRTEDLLVAASDDDSIKLYNLQLGTPEKVLQSKKYGVANVKFSHHQSAIFFSSTKGSDHSLRYLSVHDNKFIRYFSGHSSHVTSVDICPRLDLLMSTSTDKSMRLWDIRQPHAIAMLEVTSGIPTASFDLQGLIFAVSMDSGMIKLYDVRSYEQGPFATFMVEEMCNSPVSTHRVRFSPDGKMLACAIGSKVYQLDAYNGDQQFAYEPISASTVSTASTSSTPNATETAPLGCCFSSDNKYIFSGTSEKEIKVWACADGKEVATWPVAHPFAPTIVEFAPKRLLLASACNILNFWIPDVTELKTLGLVT